MDLRTRLDLLLTSVALMLHSAVLPFIMRRDPVLEVGHLVIGVLLGAGLALMLSATIAHRRRLTGICR